MSKTVRIKGMNQFIKKCLSNKTGIDQAVGQEVQRSLLRVERKAKMLAPFDTGWLSGSIYSYVVNTLTGEVHSPADYSIYVEEGTRYQMAQPFLFPALKADYPVLMNNLNKLMKG